MTNLAPAPPPIIVRLASTTAEHRTPADYERARLSIKQDSKAIVRISRRIAKRQAIGNDWDGAANDNYEWPMAKALLAEKNHDLLRYALAYRKIEGNANSESQLGGTDPEPELMQLDQRTWVDPRTGETKYKGVRKLTSMEYTGKEVPGRSKVDPLQVKKPAKPIPKPWAGDAKVIDMIDDRKKYAKLQVALGPLVGPFESACLYGATLETVGRELGVGNKSQAMGAARALIHMALICVRDTLGELRREDFVKEHVG